MPKGPRKPPTEEVWEEIKKLAETINPNIDYKNDDKDVPTKSKDFLQKINKSKGEGRGA